MGWRWWHTTQHTVHGDNWITGEFTKRGLTPPHCTPEALARALEREYQITIAFRPHECDDPGIYGMLYHGDEDEQTYVILFRASHSIVLRRLTLFHELAHLLFDQALPPSGHACTFRRSLVLDAREARAEAFAVGAMHYSFATLALLAQPPPAGEDDRGPSFRQFLRQTGD